MRFLIANFFLIFFLIFFASNAWAASDKYITIVNPIRGKDFFQLTNTSPKTNLEKQWTVIKEKNLSATWLIRPDAMHDQEIVSLVKSFPPSQEIGLFMEITPTWAKSSGVTYHQNTNWHTAGSVFLTGYQVDDRKKLIDEAFEKYKQVFGNYPKSVGAWWIDAGSLLYMREKYGILANMDVADQYSTDNYQVWGQFWSTPFYPARRNALVPASAEAQKIGVVTIQWATRDPFNAYGNGVLDSTYSVQANDYANEKYHKLDVNYFKKLLSIYLDNPYSSFGQVTVGMENDFSWDQFGGEYKRALELVSQRQKEGTKVLTMEQFAKTYTQLFPDTSPPQIIFADDPLGSGGKVLWFQNLRYRVGWFYTSKGSTIRDLRLLRESLDEPCLEKRCDELNLAMVETRNVDEVTYGDQWIIDEGKIFNVSINKLANGVEVDYVNQAAIPRKLKFVENDIYIDNKNLPVSFWIDEALGLSRSTATIHNNFNYQLKDGIRKTLRNQSINFLKFLLFAVFFLYLPGITLLKKTRLSNNQKFILSWPVGICIFTLSAFVLGYAHFWWGLVILPIASLMYIRKSWVFPSINWSWANLLTGFVIILGSITWLATTVKSGLIYDFGMGFWGAHGHDAIWHLSLMESLKSGLPAQNPTFASVSLGNYHYFYDLLLTGTNFLTSISPADLYFRTYPILISLLIGTISFLLARKWFNSSLTAVLAIFFVYFGGSFGWLVSNFKHQGLGGESLFWAQQAISTLINPPFAISILLFLAGLYLFHEVIEQKKYYLSLMVPLIIIWGSLIEFKAYAGVLVLGSLLVVSLVELSKGNWSFLKIFLPTGLLSALIFLPNNIGGVSLFALSPFWLIHSMVDSPDRLGWIRLSLARMAGVDSGNWFKFLAAEVIGFLIFLVGNLGTRIIGLTGIRKLNTSTPFGIFVISFLGLSLIIPLSFVQKGTTWNIVQFFYYFLLLSSFFAASSLVGLIKKFNFVGFLMVGLVIFLTIPTTWDTLGQYLPSRPPSRISNLELEALNFLKNQPKGTVLSYPFDSKLKQRYEEPKPLYAYDSTAYVSAISGKPEYIADTVNLDILGIDYKGRSQAQKDILAAKEPEVVKRLLKDNNISYVYVPKIAKFSPDEERFGLKRIFSNDEAEIFAVK